MKRSKSEVTYLILSIILVALAAGIYLIFGNSQTKASSTEPTSSSVASSSTTSEEELEEKAKASLAEAQDKRTSEAITNAQAAINKLSDEAKKIDLQSQLDAISAEINNESNAESAVAAAEAEQTSANVTAAQDAVDTVTNQDVKDQLQTRIDAVANAISARSASVATQTTPSSATTTHASTFDDTTTYNNNYSSSQTYGYNTYSDSTATSSSQTYYGY